MKRTLLSVPIEFPVYMDGDVLTATVREKVDEELFTIYRVSFSNGFEDMFALGHETNNVYGTKTDSKRYADAIQYDLVQVLLLEASHFWHVFQHEIEGVPTNIWVIESTYDGQLIYLVHCRNELRFGILRANGQWTFAETSPAFTATDLDVMKRTGFMLDSLL